MKLSLLSDIELESQLVRLSGKERHVILLILDHLAEMENRRSFRDAGYSSLFDFCTRKLKYSEGAAYRRISGMRCFREFPELRQLYLEGEVNLCSVTTAAQSLREKRATVSQIVGKSKREVEQLVAPERAVVRESIKPISVTPPPLPLFTQHQTAPLKEDRFLLKFSLSQHSYQQFEEVKNRLSNTLGKNLSVESVMSKLLDDYLKPKRKIAVRRVRNSRYIPLRLRRVVYERDGGKCSYCAPDGTKCTAKQHLEYDHIMPFALGGKTELGNLRLLCSAHNKLQAERCFWRSTLRSGQESQL